MITGTVQIVFNHFPEIQAGMEPRAGKAVAETARAVADAAKGRVPVDTGALQASIQAASAGASYQWVVTANTAYALFVEYGTGNGPAQPYMVPSAESEQNPFLDRMSRYVVDVAA